MARPGHTGTGGFSLVEIVVALTIFSLAVVAMLQVFGTCLQSTGTSTNTMRACLLAQGLMSETLAVQQLEPGEDAGQWEVQFPGANWTRRIAATETTGLYEVSITVAWPERGQDREFELTTLAAEH